MTAMNPLPLAAALTLTVAFPLHAATVETEAGPMEITEIADGFDMPWGVDFLPDGGFLVTEIAGTLVRVDAEGGRTEVSGVPQVVAQGQGGLLDVAVARDFGESREIFLTYSKPQDSGAGTALMVARLNEAGDGLTGGRVLFEMAEGGNTTQHYGSRVTEAADGTLSCKDDAGFQIAFRITRRVTLDMPAEMINAPGAKPGRAPNHVGADEEATAAPRTLSHIVYFVPDMERMANFYIDRLGFVITDKFTNTGPFLRPQANLDHHVLFMIQTPEYMQGIEHLAFHMSGPADLMLAGSRMIKKGYESFWGPGRHKFGSNWFWYFSSPLRVNIEYDADMDLHDGDWVMRETPMSAEASQMFLFENVEKWSPGGPPPGKS